MKQQNRKEYRRPELVSRRVQLGVFGDYSEQGGPRRGNEGPLPMDVIRKLDIHME
ncbi:hypothetical protein KDM41_05475 [bacterium]|nr:hypothetical protein [bacterium]